MRLAGLSAAGRQWKAFLGGEPANPNDPSFSRLTNRPICVLLCMSACSTEHSVHCFVWVGASQREQVSIVNHCQTLLAAGWGDSHGASVFLGAELSGC